MSQEMASKLVTETLHFIWGLNKLFRNVGFDSSHFLLNTLLEATFGRLHSRVQVFFLPQFQNERLRTMLILMFKTWCENVNSTMYAFTFHAW